VNVFNADKIIRALQTEAQGMAGRVQNDSGNRNTAIAAGAAGVLGGLLLSKMGGKFGRQAATLGGLAALGGLAYQAYQKHKGTEAGSQDAFLPSTEAQRESVGMATLRAMIAAMKADGRIENSEKAKLFDRLAQVDLSDAEKAFLFDELAKPLDIAAVVADATTPALAVEIYTASLVAIDPEGPAERAYLSDLARRLNLEPGLVASIHAEALAAA
jgi:uncharacterized membrane protein YebE (DUF533 family)